MQKAISSCALDCLIAFIFLCFSIYNRPKSKIYFKVDTMLLLTRLFGFSSMGNTLHGFNSPSAAILPSSQSPCGTLQKRLELLLGKGTRKNTREQGGEMAVLQQGNRTLIKNNTNSLRTTFTPLCLD